MDGFDRRERRRRYRRQQQLKEYGIFAGILLGIFLLLGGMVFLGVWLFYGFGDSKTVQTNGKAQIKTEEDSESEKVTVKKKGLKGVTVMVDPGHGERVPGCVVDDIMEKDITLQVSLKLRDALKKEGATVKMTREDDSVYPRLKERGRMANEAKVDYFISIHCNFYEDDANIYGFESYYYNEEKSAALSEAMVHAAKVDGIAIQDSKYGNFQVLRDAKMPAVLLEIGYMSNAAELQNMCNEAYQQRLAEAIAKGLAAFDESKK